MDRSSNDLQISAIPQSDSHANTARKIMEIMLNLHHWDKGIFEEVETASTIVHQIALHVFPLAGASFDSSRICSLVQKAECVCAEKRVGCLSNYALAEAIKGLGLSEKESGASSGHQSMAAVSKSHHLAGQKTADEGESTDLSNVDLLANALPRLLRVVRKEIDPERRAVFSETLEAVFLDYVTTQVKAQMHADTKILESSLLPPGMNDRVRQVKEILTRLCRLARENVDNEEINRLILVFLRILRC
ncbi:hypothetical protein PDIG_55060 [Penicillium digitatum PHI26]|uniref:Uncharacterized protein n=2 Tax=Penicillium digitatum TaxID=36651 RepID=K9FMB4_PEND2|nr:hypothetical protein PDIP_50270 [Penicillium digitatum Pd1]EKV10775.1 hypothetical protein PDIG_55060 [Penicillium digitatum PHI26]EKV13078.1 hypothetical protein PDIP_50270 [Penicillium digitatum Pd1]